MTSQYVCACPDVQMQAHGLPASNLTTLLKYPLSFPSFPLVNKNGVDWHGSPPVWLSRATVNISTSRHFFSHRMKTSCGQVHNLIAYSKPSQGSGGKDE